MNKIIFILFVFINFSLLSEVRVLDTLQNVDLIAEDRKDDQGRKNGVNYYAHNRNNGVVYVTIDALNAKNVYENLTYSQVVVDASDKVFLGWVIQTKNEDQSHWEVEWTVESY